MSSRGAVGYAEWRWPLQKQEAMRNRVVSHTVSFCLEARDFSLDWTLCRQRLRNLLRVISE